MPNDVALTITIKLEPGTQTVDADHYLGLAAHLLKFCAEDVEIAEVLTRGRHNAPKVTIRVQGYEAPFVQGSAFPGEGRGDVFSVVTPRGDRRLTLKPDRLELKDLVRWKRTE